MNTPAIPRQLRKAHIRFSDDENIALDAILTKIQSGLLSFGLVISRDTQARNDLNALRQLIPNTSALRAFFRQKHLQNPKVAEFKRLSSNANTLAAETRQLAPLAPAATLESIDRPR